MCKATKKGKRIKKFTWQVKGCGQLVNSTLLGVLFYITSMVGKF